MKSWVGADPTLRNHPTRWILPERRACQGEQGPKVSHPYNENDMKTIKAMILTATLGLTLGASSASAWDLRSFLQDFFNPPVGIGQATNGNPDFRPPEGSNTHSVPDGGATLLLAALGLGALALAKKAARK